MSYYVFTNPEKERMAREAVELKGIPSVVYGNLRDQDGAVRVAHCALYHKALEQNPKLSGEELVMYIYRGLGGKLEEFKTPEEAGTRAEKLKSLRIKQAKKDAAL